MRLVNAPRVRIIMWLLIPGFASLGTAQTSKPPARVEIVHIDGRKNPELIPEWSAWEDVFSTIGGIKDLPSAVLAKVSKEEADLILRESAASIKRTEDCNTRVLALATIAKKEKPRAVIERTKEIRLECRWANLLARDRVMAALNPEARIAMIEFVDLLKAGTSFTLARSELAFFRQPQ